MKLYIALVTLIASLAQAATPAFYRFVDANGVTQLSDRVPPASVKGGYEVLDSRLFVIEVVAPEPTQAELAAMARAEAERMQAQRQAQQDRELLSRFPSVADVELAKASDLKRLELQHDILTRQLQAYERNLAELKRRAAREERNGEVSLEVLDAMAEREMQQFKAEQRVLEKQSEIEALTADYSRKKLRVASLTLD